MGATVTMWGYRADGTTALGMTATVRGDRLMALLLWVLQMAVGNQLKKVFVIFIILL